MARTKPDMTPTNDITDPKVVVTDVPPANPFGEPVYPVTAYDTAEDAEINAGTRKPAETAVEHPLSPTDTNPNPHGTRSNLEITHEVVDKDTKIARREPLGEGDVQIEGLSHEPVHLGDGRTLAKGDKTGVTKEVAKTLTDNKQVKRV